MKVLQLMGGVVSLFFLLSCSNNNEIYNGKLSDGSIRMRLNVQERISDNLLIEFTDLKDFRCPVGAVCTNAGYVQMGIRLFSKEGIQEKELFYSDFRYGVENIDTLMGHTIELIGVTPYPFVDKPYEEPKNYTIELIVKALN